MSNLTKTLFFTLDCKNAPMKYNLWTLDNHYANSSENKFPELVITYMELNNIKALPKYFAYYGKWFVDTGHQQPP